MYQVLAQVLSLCGVVWTQGAECCFWPTLRPDLSSLRTDLAPCSCPTALTVVGAGARKPFPFAASFHGVLHPVRWVRLQGCALLEAELFLSVDYVLMRVQCPDSRSPRIVGCSGMCAPDRH